MLDRLRGVPAPLDAGELAPALAEFGSSRMLPRAAYVAPLAVDRTRIECAWAFPREAGR